MARSRALTVVISGDVKGLKNAFTDAEKAAGRTESRLGKFRTTATRALAIGGAAGGAALVAGLTKATDAAIEAEKSQARMEAQLKASGISYKRHAKEIDEVIQRTSRLAAVDDEDLQDAFTNIVRSTGDVTDSLKLTGLAADIAAAKQLDLKTAGDLVAKVAAGNTGTLSRYGIVLEKGASATEALATLQQKFGGQAEQYGKTTAGAVDRAHVALENFGEEIGARTAPLVAKAAEAFTGLITGTNGAGRAVQSAVRWIVGAYNDAREAIANFATRHRERLQQVADAARRLGSALKTIFEEVIVPVVRRAVQIIGRVLERIAGIIGAVVDTVTAIVRGDWSAAWDGFKRVVSRTIGGIAGTIKDVGGAIWDAAKAVGRRVVRGILEGLSSLGREIMKKIEDAWDWVRKKIKLPKIKFPSIDLPFIGGDGPGRPQPGAPSASLKGANSALAPLAAIGFSNGLVVSSGKRAAGGRTSTGGISYHGSGEAIDLLGPPDAMLRTFRTLRSRYGSRLAELIYTPGGTGIKNGRPHVYTGRVAAEHFDHVHVALDLGRAGPGIGDGPGARMSSVGGNAEVVFRFLLSKGFTPAQAAGIVGSLMGESGPALDTTARNPHSGAFGIAQWLGSRLTSLQRRRNPTSLRTQLAHLWAELQGPERAAFRRVRAARTIREASDAWTLGFERPGKHELRLEERERFARAVFQALGQSAGGGSRGSSRRRTRRRGSDGEAISPHALEGPLTQGRFEEALSEAELRVAEATPAGDDPVGGSPAALRLAEALSGQRRVIGARIRTIRRALKRPLRRATRVRLQNELAQLLSQHRELGEQGRALRTAPPPEETGDGGDPNQPLIDAINAKAEQDRQMHEEQMRAQAEHTAALNSVRDELRRQTDFAQAVSQTAGAQAFKALSDIMSGQLGSRVRARTSTPGVGDLAAAY